MKAKQIIFGMVITSSLILSGCQLQDVYHRVTGSQESSVNEEVTSEEAIVPVDIRELPTLDQLMQGFEAQGQIELGSELFATDATFTQTQQAFDVEVESMNVYNVQKSNDMLQSEFSFEASPGAILLLKVKVHNRSNEPFYFPIEELRLSYMNASVKVIPSDQLYPLENGNLRTILTENKGEIQAGETVEGYLVYGLGKEALQEAMAEHSVYLSVTPPRLNLTELVGIGTDTLGQEQSLYLPLDKTTEEALLLNETYIQDRLTTEWWGTKTILASDTPNDVVTTDGVSVTLNRVEVSDFVPNEQYEESFQNFVHGQVIVSVEYTVTNNSTKTVLPIDGQAVLTINNEPITSDYVLINETYGRTLTQGESYTVVKTFALDKQHYYDQWQNHDYTLQLSVPVQSEDEVTTSTSESSTTPTASEEVIEATFTIKPTLERWINESLEVVITPPNNTSTDSSSSSEEESSSDDTSE